MVSDCNWTLLAGTRFNLNLNALGQNYHILLAHPLGNHNQAKLKFPTWLPSAKFFFEIFFEIFLKGWGYFGSL